MRRSALFWSRMSFTAEAGCLLMEGSLSVVLVDSALTDVEQVGYLLTVALVWSM